jgi:hypothetical protein
LVPTRLEVSEPNAFEAMTDEELDDFIRASYEKLLKLRAPVH